MATEILFELQDVLSEPDFDTIQSFMLLYSRFSSAEAGQTRVGFQFFVENLQERYKREFKDCHKVLSLDLEELQQTLIDRELYRKPRSPESEKRRNLGKLRKKCRDDDNRAMCDWSAKERHAIALAEVARLSDEDQRTATVGKEGSRHNQYAEGQRSSSPVKNVEDPDA